MGLASAGKTGTAHELEIGFVPSLEAGALIEDIQPLADYLGDALGMPVKGRVKSSYPSLVTVVAPQRAARAAMR